MGIEVKDHGIWTAYTPDKLPPGAQEIIESGAAPAGFAPVFCRREGDGVDFYDYRNDDANWAKDSVVCTVLLDGGTGIWTVKAVFRDRTMVFPVGQRLIEITGHDVEDQKPHNEFAWMVYDPKANALLPPAPPRVFAVQDYQFAGQAAAERIISDQECDDWVTTGVVPQKLIEAVKANVTEPGRQRRVILFLKGATVIPRYHELTPLLGASLGKGTPELLDAFFLAASQR